MSLHDLIKDLEKESSLVGSMKLTDKLPNADLTEHLRVFANQNAEKASVQLL
jgi:hypothetical protein